MARGFSEETLEEIRRRADIVDIIGSRITLKRAGVDFKACCPFHNEKTPSFFVSPGNRSFHCFGCGAHGDVFEYMMRSDGMTFVDAVKTLARRTGVTIIETTSGDSGIKNELTRLHSTLASFYAKSLAELPEAQTARSYLRSRQLDDAIIARFGIGYAPKDTTLIHDLAAREKFSMATLVEAGILAPPREEHDDYYDRFRGRLIFPIRNTTGQVIAFSGRTLDTNAKIAKYVNSPETPLFRKGSVLYALDAARSNIVRSSKREALVCEGQIDVIRCHANGFNNAVAAQGTAFTEEHARILKRYADSVTLIFDNDGAGRKAAVRTGRLLLKEGLPVRIASLPEGEDPDSFLRKNDQAAFEALLNTTESLVTFQIRSMRQSEEFPDATDALNRITTEVIATLSECSKAVMRSFLLQEAANALDVPQEALAADLNDVEQKKALSEKWRDKPHNTTVRPRPKENATYDKESHDTALSCIAELLIHSPDAILVDTVKTWLPTRIMAKSPAADIISAIVADYEKGSDFVSKLSTDGDSSVKDLLETLATRDARFTHFGKENALSTLRKLIISAWIDHWKEERTKLNHADATQCRRRLELTHTIKIVETSDDWNTCTQIFSSELDIPLQQPPTASETN